MPETLLVVILTEKGSPEISGYQATRVNNKVVKISHGNLLKPEDYTGQGFKSSYWYWIDALLRGRWEKGSQALGRIQTRDLQIMRRVLYLCAKPLPTLKYYW